MKVENPTGNTVKGSFYGYGEIVIGPAEVKDIPGAVFDAWQDPNLWGGRECPLRPYMPPAKYTCKVCGEEFPSPQKLAAHVKNEHPKKEG